MERPKKREVANPLKTAAVAGLVFLAGGKIEAQDIGNWRPVLQPEFKRLHIPDSMIQKVRAEEGDVPLDETKMARTFTDRRNTFYWINPKTPKSKEWSLANQPTEEKAISENELARLKAKNKERTLPEKNEKPPVDLPVDAPAETATNIEEAPIEETEVVSVPETISNTEEAAPEVADEPPTVEKDPEELEMDTVMERLEEYTNRFDVREAYVTAPNGEEYKIDDLLPEAFKDPDDKTLLSGALVIHDNERNKDYKVLKRNKHSLPDPLFYFAEAFKNSGARGACLEFLKRNGKADLSVDERVKYLQELFATHIEDLHKYKEPPVYDDLAFRN